MLAAGTKAGVTTSEYRDGEYRKGDAMGSSPTGPRTTGTLWHSSHFTLTSYWKIEPFFIEK